ncbi:Fic family protein [Allokutzneria sp. NRRL B-24872]|uniref:Fic family protein n=1 Tax=Allokutzneria sp. NRRL B-24872 TaxID=1137961 RepID=UPI001178CE46|nr:Fic family protein [Allokutzneria sp. NRRL B-24872]
MTAPDHLRSWLTVRESVPWHEVRAESPSSSTRDGAVHDIRTYDHARSPVRAARLLAALDQARSDAASDAPLDFALLSSWQRRVLDVPHAPLRIHPAFAKNGRERYGPIDFPCLQVCLAERGDTTVPIAARAARVYLDVCFFHPFGDGNARSAFLALVFVLTRAGITLGQVGPLRRLPRRADDASGALAFAELVSVLVHSH